MRRIAILVLAAALGCGSEELDGGSAVVCDEIGRTVANVAWGCGAKLEAANARGRDFNDRYACEGPTTAIGEYMLEVGLACPVALAQTTCDIAAQDLAVWFAALPSCQGIVVVRP